MSMLRIRVLGRSLGREVRASWMRCVRIGFVPEVWRPHFWASRRRSTSLRVLGIESAIHSGLCRLRFEGFETRGRVERRKAEGKADRLLAMNPPPPGGRPFSMLPSRRLSARLPRYRQTTCRWKIGCILIISRCSYLNLLSRQYVACWININRSCLVRKYIYFNTKVYSTILILSIYITPSSIL